MSSLPSAAPPVDEHAQRAARGRLRNRRLLHTAATMLLAKVVSASAALVSLPLTLGYLGPERFGMWATISSAILVFSLADLGIGNGMLNRVSAAYGRGDAAEIGRVASSAVAMLLLIALVLLAVLAAVYPFVPWHALFNVHSDLARAEAGPAAALFVVFWSLRLPLAIVQRVQFGMQLGHLSNGWDIAASLASLAAIVVATQYDAGVYLLVAAFAGMPVLMLAINWLVFFRVLRPDVRPRLRQAHVSEAVPVIRAGLLILVLQVTGALSAASDSFVIAQVLGAEAVAGFAVAEKLFSLIPVVVLVVSHSMWPAFAEASARGDVVWIRRSLARVLGYTLTVSVTLSVGLVLFGADLIRLWVRDAVQPALLLLLAFGILKVLESLGATASIYLNSRNILREQLLPSLLFLVSAITMKFWLVGRIGVSGAIWATIASFCVFIAAPYLGLMLRSVREDRLADRARRDQARARSPIT